MKSILIVDDTYEKKRVIASILKEIDGLQLDYCNSSREAVEKLNKKIYDILIVDIQIPESMGDEISMNGGVELIKYCSITKQINKPAHIIGITSHKDTYDSHSQYFSECGWPLILGIEDENLIRSIIETKLEFSHNKTVAVDVAIITALQRVELEAVLNLPCEWIEHPDPSDNNMYHKGVVTTASGVKLSIVATSCSRMGMASAAATTMKVCLKYNPSIVIMTGIAAGVESKTNFGDILVADPCWDWGSGKSTVVGDFPQHFSAPHQQSLEPRTRSIFQSISTQRTFLDDISNNWPAVHRPPNPLNLYVGPVATGAVVLENPATVENIVSQHRETIGVEMEAYGFSYAVSISGSPPPQAIVIKSVCDFANPDKNDDWQNYAAYTSAQIAYKYLTNYV